MEFLEVGEGDFEGVEVSIGAGKVPGASEDQCFCCREDWEVLGFIFRDGEHGWPW